MCGECSRDNQNMVVGVAATMVVRGAVTARTTGNNNMVVLAAVAAATGTWCVDFGSGVTIHDSWVVWVAVGAARSQVADEAVKWQQQQRCVCAR
eukprot:scaffold301182_cov24-Tisochrysis_lutea.AAC.1